MNCEKCGKDLDWLTQQQQVEHLRDCNEAKESNHDSSYKPSKMIDAPANSNVAKNLRFGLVYFSIYS